MSYLDSQWQMYAHLDATHKQKSSLNDQRLKPPSVNSKQAALDKILQVQQMGNSYESQNMERRL